MVKMIMETEGGQVASDNMTSRARHGGCTYSNRFYVFGGSNGHNFLFNDLKEHVIGGIQSPSSSSDRMMDRPFRREQPKHLFGGHLTHAGLGHLIL